MAKGTVRIIAGLMKGRIIPFSNSRFKDAEITPQKVKGALFSIIGGSLRGRTFIDLYSGSGQIGFEALSRECTLAVFIEKDRQRYEFIKEFVRQTGNEGRVLVLNLAAQSALKYLSGKGIMGDVVFLDPPYEKLKGETSVYGAVLDEIHDSGILLETSTVIVQHFSANELPEECKGLIKTGTKKYGSTSLTIYHLR